MGILLNIVALILVLALAPIGIIYSLISFWYKANFKKWISRVNDYFLSLAIVTDVIGGVFIQDLFNDILIKKTGYQFGNRSDTVSCALGINERDGTLKICGKWLCALLNWLDKDHCKNSIK